MSKLYLAVAAAAEASVQVISDSLPLARTRCLTKREQGDRDSALCFEREMCIVQLADQLFSSSSLVRLSLSLSLADAKFNSFPCTFFLFYPEAFSS